MWQLTNSSFLIKENIAILGNSYEISLFALELSVGAPHPALVDTKVYEGAGTGMEDGEGLGYQVVTTQLQGLEHRNHTLVCDNLFSSPRLFHDLMADGIWAIGTCKTNRCGLPAELARHKGQLGRRGSLVIKIHRHRQMTAILWHDSDVLGMLSTGADAWTPNLNVLRRERGKMNKMVVPSTPIHLEYQEFMRGVDVTDQLRGTYSIQLRSHKWWQKVFCFVFDQSIINMYILYIEECVEHNVKPLKHLFFNLALADYLVKPLIMHRAQARVPVPRVRLGRRQRLPHGPSKGRLKRQCVVCKKVMKYFCVGCGYKWLCVEKGCFTWYHNRPNFLP